MFVITKYEIFQDMKIELDVHLKRIGERIKLFDNRMNDERIFISFPLFFFFHWIK